MPHRIAMNNEEIEIACDLLWFVKRETGLSGSAETLWERLQPIRDGDFGGSASTHLSPQEALAIADAGEFTRAVVPLDDDEAALVTRLRNGESGPAASDA